MSFIGFTSADENNKPSDEAQRVVSRPDPFAVPSFVDVPSNEPVERRKEVGGEVDNALTAPLPDVEVGTQESEITEALKDSLNPGVSDEFLKKFQEKFPIEMERVSFAVPADFQTFDTKEARDAVAGKLNGLLGQLSAESGKSEEMLKLVKDFGGVFKLLAESGKINTGNVSKFWSYALTKVMLAKSSTDFKYKNASAALKEKYKNLKYSLALKKESPYFSFELGDGSEQSKAEIAKLDAEYQAEKVAVPAVVGAAAPVEGAEGQAKAPVKSPPEEQAKIDALKNTMIGGILSKWLAFDEVDPETSMTGFQKLFRKKDWFTSFILGLLSLAGFEGLEEFRGDVDDVFGLAGEKGKEALNFVTEGVAGLAGGVLALEGLKALSKSGKAVEDEIKTSEDIKLEEKNYESMTVTIPESVDGAKVTFPKDRSAGTYKILKDEEDKGQMESLSEPGTYVLNGTIPGDTVFGKGVMVKLNEKPVVTPASLEAPAA